MSYHVGQTWNEYMNYCDDDELLVNWFNENMSQVAWQMFKNQNDWIYLNGERGVDENGRALPPKIKSYEQFNDAFDSALRYNFGWMFSMMKMEYLRHCVEDGIELDDEAQWNLDEYMGTYYSEDKNE